MWLLYELLKFIVRVFFPKELDENKIQEIPNKIRSVLNMFFYHYDNWRLIDEHSYWWIWGLNRLMTGFTNVSYLLDCRINKVWKSLQVGKTWGCTRHTWKRQVCKWKKEMQGMERILEWWKIKEIIGIAMLTYSTERLEWNTTGLDGNYLTELEKWTMWIYKREIHVWEK